MTPRSRLNHPNIINVKGAFLSTIPYQPHSQQHTHFCLVLELASAGNLLEHYRDYQAVFQSSFPPIRARSAPLLSMMTIAAVMHGFNRRK